MDIKQLNEELDKLLKEELSDEEYQKRLDAYKELASNFYGLGANIEVENEDDKYEPWIVAYYDIDNDLKKTYDHDLLLDDLSKLNDEIRFFDQASDFGSGILGLYLSIDLTCNTDIIKKIQNGLEKVPNIIEKYYKTKNESKNK